ncbi:ABC transporter permease [Thermoflexus sp.]|uniref:ABC transporter permease n=2 Tax=Thermoflexus sp. TaxID=1969742 RepID=UPI0025ED676E|nr:ABC transporter permease [Thermoflexus sp.]MCS6964677.1 ABC transporter permease [Thermoflexus sp.]MCX7689706.1 ABC transporter permease [Thermoflexus sp.]MDW8185182.1 ABC transporter permease [Anaerolineae bacterium]
MMDPQTVEARVQMRVRQRAWSISLAELRRYPEVGALAGFLAVFLSFSIVAPHFLTPASLAGIMTIAAELGLVAIGVTLLMIAGEFDLSVGSVLGVSAMAFALMARAGIPHLIAFLGALGLAAAIGALNGWVVTRGRLPSFIVTLGSMMFWRGVLLAVTGGFPIAYEEKSLLMFALSGRLPGGFHASALWFLGVALIATLVLTRTPFGNAIFASGGNPQAARALGVEVARVKQIGFILTAVLAALAGIIQFSRFGSVDPLRGEGMELEAIAATVTGGTLLTGGYGSVMGTVLGALIVGMVRNGLVLAGAPAYWYRAFIGLVLVGAVIINLRIRRSG